MTFTFLYHDCSVLILKASDCKHYSGHAALTNASVKFNNTNLPLDPKRVFARLNIALNNQLGCMFPSEDVTQSNTEEENV